jgi:hypothetical protein
MYRVFQIIFYSSGDGILVDVGPVKITPDSVSNYHIMYAHAQGEGMK